MITLLLLLPFALLVLAQVLSLVVLPGQIAEHQLAPAVASVPLLAYAAAALASGAALVLAVQARSADPWTGLLVQAATALVAAVLICAAPLLWGRSIHEFHASHHLIRAAVVAVALVLYFVHACLSR